MTVLLYLMVAVEILSVITILADARKPQVAVTNGGAGCAGLVIIMYLVPLVWVLTTSPPLYVTVLASLLLADTALAVVRMVRQIYGLRGPKTPLSVTLLTLSSLADIAILLVIIQAV